jgi:hypothetical protein
VAAAWPFVAVSGVKQRSKLSRRSSTNRKDQTIGLKLLTPCTFTFPSQTTDPNVGKNNVFSCNGSQRLFAKLSGNVHFTDAFFNARRFVLSIKLAARRRLRAANNVSKVCRRIQWIDSAAALPAPMLAARTGHVVATFILDNGTGALGTRLFAGNTKNVFYRQAKLSTVSGRTHRSRMTASTALHARRRLAHGAMRNNTVFRRGQNAQTRGTRAFMPSVSTGFETRHDFCRKPGLKPLKRYCRHGALGECALEQRRFVASFSERKHVYHRALELSKHAVETQGVVRTRRPVGQVF